MEDLAGDVDDFRSCSGDEDDDEDWEDTEECLAQFPLSSDDDDEEDEDYDEVSSSEDVDESSVRMLFKGVSVSENAGGGGLGSKGSGIGVVIETAGGELIVQVQKKLDFCVADFVADHLALLDGLIEVQRNGVQKVVAFTDSQVVYHQIAEAEPHEDQLLVALGYRILELANKFEDFSLKLVCRSVLERPLKLAQEAVGIDGSVEECLICCSEQKQQSEIIKLKCSHSFCIGCMTLHLEGKLQAPQVPIKCPQIRCKHYISNKEFEHFLSLSAGDKDIGDITLLQLAQSNNWRRCQQCSSMIELARGCYHVTCWCGHEFCYSCGAVYQGRAQTCQCDRCDDRDNEDDGSEASTSSIHELDQRRWELLNPLPSITDSYSEQERAQLALIQGFLAGGFGLNDEDHHLSQFQAPAPECSDSYLDAIKDLNQLPWLERFVSVISDSYHDDYIQ